MDSGIVWFFNFLYVNWAAPDEAERAFAVLFNVLGIEAPDRERLAFYLRLDPLTWG